MEKTVLVKMGQHNRLISFSTPTTSPSKTNDVEVLKETIQDKFADVLQPGQKFFLQKKNEEWVEFLDLQGEDRIANGSTIKAVIIETPPSVTQCGMEPAPSQTTQSMTACPGRVQGAESENTSAIKLVFVAAVISKTVSYDNTDVELIIWDTAGQERYHSLAPMYYRGAHAAVVVYDITDQVTFTKAKEWINKLKSLASPGVIIALAGNKADLEAHRKVNSKEAKAYAEENDLIFLETSAKTDMNVEEIFRAIVKKLPKTVVTQQRVELDGRSLRVLGAEAQPEKTKRRC